MHLSVVIPTWTGTEELAQMTLALCRSIRPMVDELIITEDGEYCRELQEMVDVYLIHSRLGHTQNLALGIKATSGNYVGVLDSDIALVKGSLRDLCIQGKFACGQWLDSSRKPMTVEGLNRQRLPNDGPRAFMGWCFVVDRLLLADFAIPTDSPNEGIDEWTKRVSKIAPYAWTDKLKYIHLRTQSYEARSELIRMARECSQ